MVRLEVVEEVEERSDGRVVSSEGRVDGVTFSFLGEGGLLGSWELLLFH